MAYVKATPFKPQFDDSNGNLLASGTIEFYVWDTATPAAVYTDSAGAGSATTMTLDARGEPTNDIFYDTAVIYKAILKDAAGATIDTLGPIYPPFNKGWNDANFGIVFQTVAAAKAATDLVDTQSVSILGYHAANDGGGGAYRYEASNTDTANNGTIIALDTLPGRLVHTGHTVISVKTFGAVGDGVTDDTSALQAAINYVLGGIASNQGKSVSRSLCMPMGRYKVTSTLDASVAGGYNNVLSIYGEGKLNSTILDYVTTGPCFKSEVAFMNYDWKDFGFEVHVEKPAHYCTHIDSNTINSKFTNIEWSGKDINVGGSNGNKVRALAYFTDNWQFTFDTCQWRNVQGIGLHTDCPTLNGGNITLINPVFQNCLMGYWTKGGATNNSIHLTTPKFVQSTREIDYQNIASPTSFTLGATSVNIGTGHSIAGGDLPIMLVLGNDSNMEAVLCTAYDSGTGIATLATGLLFDYSSASSIECIAGGIGFFCSSHSPSLKIDVPHFERNGFVISGAQGVTIDSLFASQGTVGNYFGGTDSFIGYVTARAANVTFVNTTYSTSRVDKKWLNIVNAAGVGGVPGPVKIDGATHVAGGSSTFPAPGYQTQGGGVFDVIERVKYLFQRDVVQTYAGRVNLDGTTGGLPSGWTSAKLSTGRYEITHNFGSTGYEFISQATSGNNYSRENSKATNTFEYYTIDAAGTAVDADSKFILTTTSHIPSA